MLEVVGGQRPGRHNELLGSEEYRQELYREDLSVFDAHDAPGHYQHLRYLSDMLTEPDSPDYAAQVCCLSYHGFCLAAICMNELDDYTCAMVCMYQHALTLGLSCWKV